jgi:ribosomal protein S27AE
VEFTVKFLDRLDRIVAPIAIPNPTVVLVVSQLVFWLASLLKPQLAESAVLVWNQVLAGEVWRLVTFLLIAPTGFPLLAIFYFYILYMMGMYLEQVWGVVRFNAFLYLGTALTVMGSVLVPDAPLTGLFLQATLFLAFATFNPDFQFLLFFILPMKIKYLAWLQAAMYLLTFIFGDLAAKILVFTSIGNYLIFFGRELFTRGRGFHRRLTWQTKQAADVSKPRHVCSTCGLDSKMAPRMDFRYCSKCNGEHAYCKDHLYDHVHKNT